MQNNYDLDLKTIQLQNERLLREISELHKMLEAPIEKSDVSKEFYTVQECAEMKGAASLSSYKANRFMLPGAGNSKYCVYILGRLAFPASEVKRWLTVDDSSYLDYARECGVTVIPEKYLRLAQKAKQKAGGNNEL